MNESYRIMLASTSNEPGVEGALRVQIEQTGDVVHEMGPLPIGQENEKAFLDGCLDIIPTVDAVLLVNHNINTSGESPIRNYVPPVLIAVAGLAVAHRLGPRHLSASRIFLTDSMPNTLGQMYHPQTRDTVNTLYSLGVVPLRGVLISERLRYDTDRNNDNQVTNRST